MRKEINDRAVYFHNRSIALMNEALYYRSVLKSIRDRGYVGSDGKWCAEQAEKALEWKETQ